MLTLNRTRRMMTRFFSNHDPMLQLYLDDIAKKPTMSVDEEQKVAVLAQKGDAKARKKLVEANLRFVVSVARNYENQGLPLSDLINVGNIGLVRASHRFDAKKNFKFISYAVWWIRQAILQELANQSRVTRYPLNRISLIYKVHRMHSDLMQKYQREPSIEEIADSLQLDLSDIEMAADARQLPVLLDKPLLTGSGTTGLEMLIDEQNRPDDDINERADKDLVNDLLSLLNLREQKIIRLYFGTNEDQTSYTLEEIGQRLNLTRERVRQIKDAAVLHIKSHGRTRRLRAELL